jgi:hypothetical protein
MSFPWLPAVKAYDLNVSILLDQFMELEIAFTVNGREPHHGFSLVVYIELYI